MICKRKKSHIDVLEVALFLCSVCFLCRLLAKSLVAPFILRYEWDKTIKSLFFVYCNANFEG